MAYTRPNPSAPKRRAQSALTSLVEAEKMMQIAILLPSAAFVGWILGMWADKLLHTSWIQVFGILFGGVAGLIYVIRIAMDAGRRTVQAQGMTKEEDKP